MELYLKHGRPTADHDMSDWGTEGPRLQDVKGIHQTYGTAANVFFDTATAMAEAHRLTGWPQWDDKALTMVWEEDCVVVVGPDGAKVLHGDWGLM